MWRVDADCIGSLFTFHHMQRMCIDSNILATYLETDFDRRRRKNKIVDDRRIYKLPYEFNVINILPKCRHHCSMAYDVFTMSDTDGK